MTPEVRSAYSLEDVGAGRTAPGRLERFLYAPALVDWVIVAYFMAFSVGLYRGTPTAARDAYLLFCVGLLIVYLAGVYAFRFFFEARATYGTRLAYHLLPVAAVLTLYFNLRPILPIVNSAIYDEALHGLDVRMFGFEPTLAVEPYASARVVEWFAFFYFTYFHLMASFVFVMIASCADDGRLASFATGLILVVTVGHFGYTMVPGFGPYAYLSHDYQGPLEGGRFYTLVLDTVSRAGPVRDIFPSLHTAMPLYCALFAWRHYPRLAPLVSFFVVNIMAATIVLRWHYAIDVAAGIVLAATAFFLAPRLCDMYQARRRSAGLGHLYRW